MFSIAALCEIVKPLLLSGGVFIYYEKCQDAQNLSWRVLVDEKVSSLPVRTSVLCRQMGIHLVYGKQGLASDGYCTILNDSMYIIIRKGLPLVQTRFIVAHEMGHILLGHVGVCHLVNRKQFKRKCLAEIECEANVFASSLLAPACVLWGCGVCEAGEIAALCEISLRVAENRANHLMLLCKQDDFLTSPLEQQVWNQFHPFIHSYRQ